MAWYPGISPKKSQFPTDNECFHKLEGYLEENEAKFELYRFLRCNPTFAVDLLFGIRLYPFQHMAIKSVLEADYSMFIWSRGLSKSFSTAIAIMLYACLNQGVKIGLLSASFRQSRMIFDKIDDILAKPEAVLGRDCLTDRKRAPDMYVYHFGQSQIVALPLGDGQKLRGFRFQMIVIDEFLLMPSNIYNEVIIPFLGVVPNPTEREDRRKMEDQLIKKGLMKEEDRYIWPANKLVMLSSASYKFEYLYELYCKFEKLIMEGVERDENGNWVKAQDKASRCIMHFSYDVAPQDLYDENLLKQAINSMSTSQFDKEFNSKFLDESDGTSNFLLWRRNAP
jgi:hypothetical protein